MKANAIPPLLRFLCCFAALFCIGFAGYYLLNQQLAQSLGAGQHALTHSDFAEGAALSILASLVLTPVVMILTSKLRNNKQG